MWQNYMAQGQVQASVPGWIGMFLLALPLLMIWSMIWKGIALWRAGRKGQLGWFIALFLINTIGILEIIYLLTAGKNVATQDKPKV